MTEEHYQDGLKLPTDKDEPKWEIVYHIEGVEALERMKVEHGYLYRNTLLRTNYHVNMTFVPGNIDAIQNAYENGYEKGFKDGIR
jgi:hypothetical protein